MHDRAASTPVAHVSPLFDLSVIDPNRSAFVCLTYRRWPDLENPTSLGRLGVVGRPSYASDDESNPIGKLWINMRGIRNQPVKVSDK